MQDELRIARLRCDALAGSRKCRDQILSRVDTRVRDDPAECVERQGLRLGPGAVEHIEERVTEAGAPGVPGGTAVWRVARKPRRHAFDEGRIGCFTKPADDSADATHRRGTIASSKTM